MITFLVLCIIVGVLLAIPSSRQKMADCLVIFGVLGIVLYYILIIAASILLPLFIIYVAWHFIHKMW